MANERTYSCLPCRDLDESVSFYEILGFKRTYRQLRPNPYAVVALEDIHLHLFGMEGFNPADSYGTVIVVVPDPDALYKDFAGRLREAHGKLPVAGIPRILRPRKKFGTVSGFSLVDPGGNWLRISKLDTEEQEDEPKTEGLTHFIEVAARLGDAHGDETLALQTLENGLARFPQAKPLELARAYLYRTELALRTNQVDLAQSSFVLAKSLELTAEERVSIEDEFAHATQLLADAEAA